MAKEYIERNGLLEWAREFYPEEKVFASAVINAPTADVQEVVSCKYCKWLLKTKMICTNPHNRVFNTGKTVYSNNFCNYGTKMDKE